MNSLRKIICLVLAMTMVIAVLASCNKPQEDDKDVIATYDENGKVRESDIQYWMNYLYIYNYDQVQSGQMTGKDIATQAISTYLLNKFLEEELKKVDIEITDRELVMLRSEFAISMDEEFNETDSTTGKTYVGYEGYLEAYAITEDFVLELLKFKNQELLMAEYLASKMEPTDEELKKYFQENAINYAIKSAYIYNFALIEVKDMQDAEEVAAAKKEAEEYIAKLKSGQITYDQMLKEITEKYTVENGYSGTSAAVSEKNVELQEIEKRIKDLDEYLKVVKETYDPIMDPEADVSSNEYKQYLKYLLEVYKAKLYYVMTNELTGLYDEPIEYPNGFVILEYVNHRNSSWGDFEELRERIKNDYLNSIMNYNLTEYEANLLEQHKVVIGDFDVSEKK